MGLGILIGCGLLASASVAALLLVPDLLPFRQLPPVVEGIDESNQEWMDACSDISLTTRPPSSSWCLWRPGLNCTGMQRDRFQP